MMSFFTKRVRSISMVAAVAAGVMVVAPVRAAVYSTTAIADSWMTNGSAPWPDANRGLQTENYLGDVGVSATENAQALVRFSLAGLPANAGITSATLTYQTGGGDLFTSGRTVDLFRLLQSWVEGDGGTGDPFGSTGVTWNSRDKGGSLSSWNTPGAKGSGTDRASTATATGVTPVGIVLSFDVTGDVQFFEANPSLNHGWIVDVTQAYTSGPFINLQSRETSTDPTLTINYVVPEPASAGLLALGAIAFVRRRGARGL